MIQTLYDKFKHWSASGAVYIISDTHFCDEDCPLMDKKWISPDEQVKRINQKVSKKDTLIHLGDVGDVQYISRIRGYKVLIKGNHDSGSEKYRQYFNEVYEGPLFIAEKILLSHERIEGLDFCFNIHGHDHTPGHTGDDFHLNVAANNCNYTPVNLGEFIKNGGIKNIISLHRQTIHNATLNPVHKTIKKTKKQFNISFYDKIKIVVCLVFFLEVLCFFWLLFIQL